MLNPAVTALRKVPRRKGSQLASSRRLSPRCDALDDAIGGHRHDLMASYTSTALLENQKVV